MPKARVAPASSLSVSFLKHISRSPTPKPSYTPQKENFTYSLGNRAFNYSPQSKFYYKNHPSPTVKRVVDDLYYKDVQQRQRK